MPGIIIQITGDGAGAAEALRVIEERMQQTAERGAAMSAQLSESTERITNSFHGTTESIYATSGAIREFEGTLPIRAVERFLSETLGLGPVIQAAFPLIGAIAFAEMLNRVREGIQKIIDSSNGAAAAIQKDWNSINNELRQSSNALDVEIDKTIGEIDKLLKQPDGENNIREAFDVAREAADKLAVSIDKDLAKFNELIGKKDETIGWFGSQLTGKETTAGTESLLRNVHDRLQSSADDYNNVVSRAGESGNKENLQQAQIARIVGLQEAYDDATARIGAALKQDERAQADYESSGKTFGKDQIANINLLEGALRNLAEQQRSIGEQFADSQLKERQASIGRPDDGAKDTEKSNRSDEQDAATGKLIDNEAKKELASLEALGAAKLKVAEAYDAQALAEAKGALAARLEQLDAEHKAGLTGEAGYLEQKLKLDEAANAQESEILKKKETQVKGQIGSLGPDDTEKKIALEAQLVEIQTKLNDLSQQRSLMEQKTADAIAQQSRDVMAQYHQQAQQKTQQMLDTAQGGVDKGNSLNSKMASQAASTIGGFMNGLTSMALRGKASFKDLADSAISDIERFAMKVLEERTIIPLLNQMFGLGAGSANLGNLTNPISDSPVLNEELTDMIPYDAAGGDIPDGGMAVVGDGGDGSGSELFAPKGPGTVLPHDVLEGIAKAGSGGGGGAPNVTINNVNNSNSPVQMRSGGVSWDGEARQFVIHTVLEDMQSGGPTSQAMRGIAASGG